MSEENNNITIEAEEGSDTILEKDKRDFEIEAALALMTLAKASADDAKNLLDTAHGAQTESEELDESPEATQRRLHERIAASEYRTLREFGIGQFTGKARLVLGGEDGREVVGIDFVRGVGTEFQNTLSELLAAHDGDTFNLQISKV